MPLEQLHVVRILSPFDPRERRLEPLDWTEGKRLADYFPPVIEGDVVISVNGKIIQPEEYQAIVPRPADSVVVCPVPRGGGGGGDGKNILRTVALVAVSVFAPYTAAYAMGYGFSAAGVTAMMAAGWGGMALTVGMSVAGAMLVNSLLPVKPASKGASGGGGDFTNSPSYGVDGAKNISAEGVPVPVPYGRFRMGGNVINTHLENVENTQILYMLFNAGEGPIAGISDIEINDQPIANFQDVEYQVRLGTADQDMIPWFADTIDPHSVGQTLSQSWTLYTTTQEIDKFRLDVVFPGGLYAVDQNSGATLARTVELEIQYREQGMTDWTSLPSNTTVEAYTESVQWITYDTYDENGNYTGTVQYAPMGSEIRQGDIYYSYYDPSEGWGQVVGTVARTPVYRQVLSITDRTRSALRHSFMSPELAEGIYEIRARRTNDESNSAFAVDSVTVTDMNEIIVEDVRYKHTALLGLKIRLSDQLNGLPKVTYCNHGRVIQAWDVMSASWVAISSPNPAWIVLDMMTNRRFGGGLARSRFDIPKLKELAAHCADKSLWFNGVFDSSMNLWDAVQTVMRVARAQIVNVGTRYTFAIEAASAPVMMFSVANMISGSFKNTWLPMAERANEIEVSYFDRNDGNKQKTVRVYDPAAIAAGRPPRSASITLIGVDNAGQAYAEGMLQLNMNRYILQTVEFGAPIEAIACTVGDVIYVQHDMPQWGFAGRCKAGSTTTSVHLDRDVTLSPGVSYKFLTLYDAVERVSGTIASITGTTVALNSYNGSAAVKRLQSGAADVEVLGVANLGGGAYGVEVASTTGLVVGANYTLWDTDVIEEVAVTNPAVSDPVTTDTLTVTALSSAPPQFQQWTFGATTQVKKPFRVKAITGSHDYRRDITAIEYNASIYDLEGAVPTPNYSALAMGVDHVAIEEVTEELIRIADTIRTRVTVHFSSAQETYRRARVLVSRNNGPWEEAQPGTSRSSIEADDGEQLTFKVVAMNVLGRFAAESSAPTIAHTVIGKTAPPATVTGFQITPRDLFLELTWNANAEIDIAGYEIRLGATWADSSLVTTGLAATRHQVPVTAGGARTYLIKAIDTLGNYSTDAASVTLQIDAPTVSGLSATISGENYVLSWQADSGTLPVEQYEIRHGDAWETALLIATVRATSFSAPVEWLGARTFWVAARDVAGNVGTPASVALTVSAPAAPNMTAAISGANLVLNWTVPSASLPIEYYELRYGASWDAGVSLGMIKGTTFTLRVAWGGTREFWIAAIDSRDNVGAAGNTSVVITPPGPVDITPQVIDNNILLRWTENPGTLPIAYYEIRKGDVFASATVIGVVMARFATFFEDASGDYTYWVTALDTADNTGTEQSIATRVNQPPDYVLYTDQNSYFDSPDRSNILTIGSSNYVLEFNGTNKYAKGSPATNGIASHTMAFWLFLNALPSTYATPVSIGPASGNGKRRVDIASDGRLVGDYWSEGNASSAAGTIKAGVLYHIVSTFDGTTKKIYCDATLAASAASAAAAVGASNIVLGKLDDGANATYAINGWVGDVRLYNRAVSAAEVAEIRRGIYSDNTGLVGAWNFSEGSGLTVFDDSDGAADLTLYNSPTFRLSDLDGRYVNDGTPRALVAPVDNAETIQEHFDSRSWASPQDQIDAGYTHFIGPSPNTAYYEERIDYGAVLGATKVTVTLTATQLYGDTSYEPTISVRESESDPWTDYLGLWSVYVTNFRYVKVRLDFTASGGDDLLRLDQLNIKLDAKLRNDAGMDTASSGDSGGTQVAFNVDFVDVHSITVTPSAGGAARYGIYDFVDTPNPAGFKVLLYDVNGNRASGGFSWSAKGV